MALVARGEADGGEASDGLGTRRAGLAGDDLIADFAAGRGAEVEVAEGAADSAEDAGKFGLCHGGVPFGR